MHTWCIAMGSGFIMMHTWCIAMGNGSIMMHTWCIDMGNTSIMMHTWCIARQWLHHDVHMVYGHGQCSITMHTWCIAMGNTSIMMHTWCIAMGNGLLIPCMHITSSSVSIHRFPCSGGKHIYLHIKTVQSDSTRERRRWICHLQNMYAQILVHGCNHIT